MRLPYGADCALNALNRHFKRVNRQYKDIAGFLVKKKKKHGKNILGGYSITPSANVMAINLYPD